MAYYDTISKQWHSATGYKGGAFKRLVLNEVLLSSIPDIQDQRILELGAGNGYFLPLLLGRFAGQTPAALVITDQSVKLLEIAQKNFGLWQASYQRLDVRHRFPFAESDFDLLLATMVFNEIASAGLKRALKECYRVLSDEGLLLITITHPTFIDSLDKRGLLKHTQRGLWTMPGAGSLRLPVVARSLNTYRSLLTKAGFTFVEMEVFPNDAVQTSKPGLRKAGRVPLALLFKCLKTGG